MPTDPRGWFSDASFGDDEPVCEICGEREGHFNHYSDCGYAGDGGEWCLNKDHDFKPKKEFDAGGPPNVMA